MSILRQGVVFVRKIRAGILQETDAGYLFQYDSGYLLRADASAVSLTLPLQAEPYTSNILFPFFDESFLFTCPGRRNHA